MNFDKRYAIATAAGVLSMVALWASLGTNAQSVGYSSMYGQPGPIGQTGTQGPQGVAGTNGAVGPQGPAGSPGAQGPKGDTGDTGATGATGSQGPTGNTGATGPAGLGTISVSISTRTLNTNFTPSATKSTFVCYTARTQVTNPLLVGTSTATVRLLSDTSVTPTTERGRVEASSAVGVTVALALTTSNTAPICYIVPAGHNVRLESTTSGTGTATLVSQFEETLG